MGTLGVGTILRYVRNLVEAEVVQGTCDGEILRRFVANRDEQAFAVLLQRHAQTVWGVCYHLLRKEQDAEDAFQATFLLLARKASSIRKADALGCWLHGVAYRIALRLKRSTHTRQAHEKHAAVHKQVAVPADLASRELQAALNEEVQRLPQAFRAPFVLCCLDSKTREEAAHELGCCLGTISSRIARARTLLQRRLARRGVTLSGVLCAGALWRQSLAAAVPTTLLRSTAQAAVVGGVSGNEVVSTTALLLADAMGRTMTMTRWLLVTVFLVGCGVLATTAGLHSRVGGEKEPPDPQSPSVQAKELSPRTDLFGDPLPPGALARMGTVRYAQGDSMDGYPVLAPDQKTFVTVSHHTPYRRGRVLCLWETATGKELRHIDDPDFENFQAFFLKTENLLATFGISRKTVEGKAYAYAMQFWDPATGKKAPGGVQVSEYHFEPWALSLDEQWLVSASRQPPVLVRDRKTGKVLAQWKGDGARIDRLAFSPNGKTVAIACAKAIYFWDWQGTRATRRLGDFPEDVLRLSFAPDGKSVAAAIWKEGVRVWETTGLTEVRRFPGEQEIRFFPDGKSLISTTTGVVWDLATGKERARFENCADCLTLDFSLDGKTVMGYRAGRICRWDAATGKDQSTPALPIKGVMFHQVGFLPDGKTVVSASPDGAVRLWDSGTGREQRTLVPGTVWDHQQPTYMRVAPDGTVVVVRNKRLSFFKGQGPAREIGLTDFPEGSLASLNVSPDGKTLVLAGGTETKRLIQVWDLPGRKLEASFTPPENTALETIGISSGREVAACVGDSICLLSARTGAITRTLVKRPEARLMRNPGQKGDDGGGYSYFHGIHGLTFSPDGYLLASGGHPDGALTILDVFSARARHILAPPSRDNHYELRNTVFSPDGRMLASDSEPGVVDVWETSSGQRRRRFLGHRSYQTTLAFSPDSARLVSGNRDATLLVWDVFGVWTSVRPTDADLETLWANLLATDGERAYQAMGQLMGCPDRSVPFLRQHLLGRKCPEAARLKNWLADLDSDDFQRREKASGELANNLTLAEPLLKESLAGNPSLEAQRRIEDILLQGDRKPLAPQTLRDLRALEILEHLGPGALRGVIQELAEGGHDPWVAWAAKDAQQRLLRPTSGKTGTGE
jgi:RNA polymerase sigma factor (sigma-70 family)